MATNGLVPKLRRWSWRIVKLLAAAAVVVGIDYWLKFSPVPVREHRIDVGEIMAEVMGTGTLEARVKSTVSPKIAGRIDKLLADQGDQVKTGQLLFMLDDADLKQQVEIARANIASAQAALDRLQADQAQAAAVLEQATQNHDRIQKLVTRGAASAEDNDKATEALRVAFATVWEAQAIQSDTAGEAVRLERAARERRRQTSAVFLKQPTLVEQFSRPAGELLAVAAPELSAVVVRVAPGADAADPRVLLAHEPTAALDSHRARQVLELFRNVAHQHGAGVIVVTHDHRTLEVFDTICQMEDGIVTRGRHD